VSGRRSALQEGTRDAFALWGENHAEVNGAAD